MLCKYLERAHIITLVLPTLPPLLLLAHVCRCNGWTEGQTDKEIYCYTWVKSLLEEKAIAQWENVGFVCFRFVY